MSFSEVAEMLRYPSIQAARKALLRGSFPIPMVRMPPRRGWYATPKTVAAFLDSLDANALGSPVGASCTAEEDSEMT